MKLLGGHLGKSLVVGCWRWRFAPGARSLFSPADLDLQAHLQHGTAQVVKHSAYRGVYRVTLNGLTVFWKHSPIHGLAGFGRQFLRPPKARMEFDRARALNDRGIPTVEPLAWANPWWRWLGPSQLITRELTGAVPLQTFLFERSRGRSRREAAEQLGRYLAHLHEMGVRHPDLHPGNILVVLDDQPRFHLLDIHNIQIGRPLTPAESCENLAILNRWFFQRSSRSDRARFWGVYAEARRISPSLARTVEARTTSANIELWEDRDDRCFANNRQFQRVRSRSMRGHAVIEIDPPFLRQMLADPDAIFRDSGQRLLKDSATSTVAEIVVNTPDGPRAMILKRFRLKKLGAALANRFRSSAAARSWQFGNALLDRALPTPRPWLMLHRRGLIGPREGYLLCERVENAVELGDFSSLVPPAQFRIRWDALAALGRVLRRFHESGLSHRDLKAANLLVTLENGEPRFHFIDLVGVRRQRKLSDVARVRNLSRLNVSFLQAPWLTRTDRLRFLRAYACWALHGRSDWKKWWKQIDQASCAKIERNRQSGRSLS